jgi:hypothetical protein
MFLEHQGYPIDENILYQDNQSAIKIEINGSKSCGRQSRHIDMRYFFMKDRLTSENIKVIYCPTEHMVADFFTKPLQGKLFHYLKSIIMGQEPISTLTSKFWTSTQERVGENKMTEKSVSASPITGRPKDKNSDTLINDVAPNVSFKSDVQSTNRVLSYAEALKGRNEGIAH